MNRIEEQDARIRELVTQGLVDAIPDDKARTAAVEAVMASLAPVYGAAAMKRRITSELRSAFKDGFMLGKTFGRFTRWHGDYWNKSETARQLRTPANDTVQQTSRYARYNFED